MKYFRETGVYKSIRKHMKQEKDILKGLRAKREDAQRLLLKQYGGMVFSQIVRIVPSREDAEEVYQDVFIKTFRHIESYDEQRASLSTWLMRIAYHEALNFMRSRDVRKIPIEDDAPEIANVPDDEMDGFFGKTDEETIGLIEARHSNGCHPMSSYWSPCIITRNYPSRKSRMLPIPFRQPLPPSCLELDKSCTILY